MKISIISDKGIGLGIATHLSSEGHAVSLVLSTQSTLGKGIVDRDDVNANGHADITIFDSDELGKRADQFREQGRRVLGASQWSGTLDSNPEYAREIIRMAGWDTEGVTNGTNLYITCWYNGAHYISTYASLVYRRFMSGGRGPDVRDTGVVGNFYQPTERVHNEFLRPLEPILRRVNHRGCFHIHALIDGDKYSVKDVSASFSSPLALLLFENSKQSTADLLLRLFDERSKPVQPLDQWAAGVLITVPPYPYPIEAQEVTLKGIETPALKHLWLVDAKREDGQWLSAGLHGKIGYVTARGNYVQEAVKRVYRTINNLEVRDLQFRNDVGKDINNLVRGLRDAGWMK